MYLDVNNLYGWVMSQLLLIYDFCWLIFDEMKMIDVYFMFFDGNIGYVFEVDLKYFMELYDYYSDYFLVLEFF